MIHAGRHTRRQKERKGKRGVTRRGCTFEKKKTEISSFVFFIILFLPAASYSLKSCTFWGFVSRCMASGVSFSTCAAQ